MYVAGAATAILAARRKPGGPCRGRCLLEQDGTLEVNFPAYKNESRTSWVGSHTMSRGPTLGVISSNSTPLPSTVSSINLSTSPSNFPYHPLSKHSTPHAKFHVHQAAIVFCPCNCTYVSAACCLSRMVWEDPTQQVQMLPHADEASLCCDLSSGKWQAKSGGCPSSNKDFGGFEDLGSRNFSGK